MPDKLQRRLFVKLAVLLTLSFWILFQSNNNVQAAIWTCDNASALCSDAGYYKSWNCGPYQYAEDDSQETNCWVRATRTYEQCAKDWNVIGNVTCSQGGNRRLSVTQYTYECDGFLDNNDCFNAFTCSDDGFVCGSCGVPSSTPSCPTTCHTDTQYPSNDCGTSTCDPNQPSEEDCPTTCHTDTKYVYDGTSCTKTKRCDPNAPARQSDPACSTTDLTLNNGDCATRTFYANCSSSTSLCYDNGSSVRCCLKPGTIPSCRTSDGSVPDGDCTSTDYLANCSASTSLCYDNGSSVRCCLQAGTCSTACGVVSYTIPNGQCDDATCSTTAPCKPALAPTVTPSCPDGVNRKMDITWTSLLTATFYDVSRTPDNGVTESIVGTGIAGTSFTDTPTVIGTGVSYKYKVRGYNATGGYSPYSEWSTAAPAVACDDRNPENINPPTSINLYNLHNKCFDNLGGASDWGSLGGIQTWASDNIGVTSLNFIVTRNEGGTIPPFPAGENLGPPTTVTNEPSLIDGVQVRRSQWKKIISFADLGVGTYSIVAEAMDAVGLKGTSTPPVNFRLANECVRPWIQTTGGDVHSNTRIYTPGGP